MLFNILSIPLFSSLSHSKDRTKSKYGHKGVVEYTRGRYGKPKTQYQLFYINAYVLGKWYRLYHPPWGRITSPDTEATLQTLRKILSVTGVNYWEPIPFPTPLHIELDYVYNVDKDTELLTVTQWNGDETLSRLTRQAKLAKIQDQSFNTIDAMLEDVEDDLGRHHLEPRAEIQPLEIRIGPPTSLNELQFQFFADFVFLWRFYFDERIGLDTPVSSSQQPCYWHFASCRMGLRGVI
jgi:hypothetical protein